MFEENNNTEFDLLMKSILQDGSEEVPAHIWDGISERLDAADRKKRIVLRWRRTAVAGSIAAALAVGLLFTFTKHTENENQDNLIAVVEEDTEKENATGSGTLVAIAAQPEVMPQQHNLNAMASSASDLKKEIQSSAAEEIHTGHDTESIPAETDASSAQETGAPRAENAANTEKAPINRHTPEQPGKTDTSPNSTWDEWPDDETGRSNIRTSVVLSGITGTNSTRSHVKQNLMKRPTVPSAKPKTGITETSTNTTYGIPLSFGTGVKIDFSKRWSAGAGINYTLLTRKFYGTYTKATDEGEVEFSQSSDIRNSQHYIGIPLNVFFNIVENKHINFYAYAGGTAEKCISNRYEILNATGNRLTHKEKVKGVQLSANIGIGAEFMLGEHLGIYIDPSLRYYFDNGQPKSIRTAQPLMLGFEMGLRARL